MPDRLGTADRSAATRCSAKSCALQPSIRRMDCVEHQQNNKSGSGSQYLNVIVRYTM